MTRAHEPHNLLGWKASLIRKKGKDLINYWKDYACFTLSDNSEPNIKEQCKEACFPGGITSDIRASDLIESSQTCWLNGPESDYRTGKELTEDQKKENPRTFKSIRTGYCTCNDPIINIAGDFFMKSVIEAGKILTKIMCPTLQALDIVVEIGSAAIPGVGKAITVGMRTGIKTAKMFKHAYEAEEAAMEWASMFVDQGFGLASEAGCKTPFKFSKADLVKRFVDFSDAPDELVPGLNYDTMPCPKGKKASKKCKEKNGEQDDNDPPSKTKDDGGSAASKTPDAARSTSASAISSVVSSSAIPSPTTDCAALGRRDEETFLETSPDVQDSFDEVAGEHAIGAVVSRDLQTRESYKPKKGMVCVGSDGFELVSGRYPPSGATFMEGRLAFGYKVTHDCGSYDWEAKPGADVVGDTEHVLEWSMIRNFFNTINTHADFKAGFEPADPESKEKFKDSDDESKGKEKVIYDFCKYWKESWYTGTAEMPNPDPKAPIPAAGEETLTQKPLVWFAEAYPFIDGTARDARKAHEDEFILLQKKINSQAKNGMFSMKPDQQIFDDKIMDQLIARKNTEKKKQRAPKYGQPNEQPRVAIQKLRSVVGAYIYMTDARVDTIFVNQVDRIGQQLENLENALAKNPRKISKRNPTRDIQLDPWKHLDLRKKWFEYMDGVYENANKKGQEFMEKNIKRMKDEYNDAKMLKQSDIDKEKDTKKQTEMKDERALREAMKTYVENLDKEWIKRKNWPKPKWNT